MSESTDERQERSEREQNQCDSSDANQRLARTREESSGDGTNKNQAADEDCSRGDPDGENSPEKRKATLGGILSQLKLLQQAHLAYVQAHEERLIQRLNENREHQKKVLDRMDVLEEEVTLYIEQLEEDQETS